LEEVAKYGTATVKRAYGDWTTQNLVGWKEHLHRHAIRPMQQFAYTKGKNSTDSAFIIDAMDLLYAGNVDGFCLVSSDSDFTRLATRMREAGKLVNNTSFDPRNYGFTKLSELVRKQAYLEVKETTDTSGFAHLSVRAR
jgi:hypothetical protein